MNKYLLIAIIIAKQLNDSTESFCILYKETPEHLNDVYKGVVRMGLLRYSFFMPNRKIYKNKNKSD